MDAFLRNLKDADEVLSRAVLSLKCVTDYNCQTCKNFDKCNSLVKIRSEIAHLKHIEMSERYD